MKLIESISQWKSSNCTRLTIVTEHGEGKVQVDLLTDHERFGTTAFIWDLYVQPDQRRKGIAKQLMQQALKRSADFGYITATLEYDETDTQRYIWYWYRGFGFEEIEFSNNYSLMVKEL